MRQGSEYPIGEAQALIVGRDAEVDLVLSDGIVSRRHARLTTGDDGLWIEDLQSTNGTFVNGVKVSMRRRLVEGDRVLVGTSILKVAIGNAPNTTEPSRPISVDLSELKTGERQHMLGTVEEVGIPELLRLVTTMQLNCVIELKAGDVNATITVHDQAVEDARIAALPDDASAAKCIQRLLGWVGGSFVVRPYQAPSKRRLDVAVPELLVDGQFKLNELHVLLQRLPAAEGTLVLAKPMQMSLRALDEAELEVLRLAHNLGSVKRVLDQSPEPDLDVVVALLSLMERGYLRAK